MQTGCSYNWALLFVLCGEMRRGRDVDRPIPLGRKRLEESCRTSFPIFTFVGCDSLHGLNVAATLREDMMQIVAYADEREVFLQEFAYTIRSEQEQA